MSDPDGTLRALAIPPVILDVDEDEMRRLGYWVVDRVIEHITTLGGQRAISEADYATLQRELGGPVPRGLSAIEEHLATLADVAGTNQQHGDHPRYFARVPGPSSYPAILGEWLATGMQSIAASWSGGSGPSALELIVCDWLEVALGLPTSCEGVLLSGGSMANITGIITARQMSGDGVVYLTDQTHASIHRGLPAIGQPVDGIRVLDSDEAYRLSPDALGAAVDADLAAGRRPMMVIATVGTTNTGTVADLTAIADLCSGHGLWLHVAGAYGGLRRCVS